MSERKIKNKKKKIKFLGVISDDTHRLPTSCSFYFPEHKTVAEHEGSVLEVFRFFSFSFSVTLHLFSWGELQISISMKSLEPDELWNSEFRKLTWYIYLILCNTLRGMWGQYPITEKVNISEAAKWLNSKH